MSWSIRLQLNGRDSFHIFLSFCMRQKGSYRLINKLHLQPMIGSTIDYIYCSKVREKERKKTDQIWDEEKQSKKNERWEHRMKMELAHLKINHHISRKYNANQTDQETSQAKSSQSVPEFHLNCITMSIFYMGLTTNGTTKRSRRFYNYDDNDDDLLC